MRRIVQNSAVVVRAGHLFRRVVSREKQSGQQATEGSREHVILGAQNSPKLGHHLSRSLVLVGGAQRELKSVQQATEADWLTRARDIRCAEESKTRPPLYVAIMLDGIDFQASGCVWFMTGKEVVLYDWEGHV
jgi:hypothetical protein